MKTRYARNKHLIFETVPVHTLTFRSTDILVLKDKVPIVHKTSMPTLKGSGEDTQCLSFKDLPREVRDMVYKYYLDSFDAKVIVPASMQTSRQVTAATAGAAPLLKYAAIFAMDRQTSEEALALHFTTKTFHHSFDGMTDYWPAKFTANLSMMNHISLHFVKHIKQGDITSYGDKQNDMTTASLINELNLSAPLLRTFELYFLCTVSFIYSTFRPITLMPSNGLTAYALRRLSSRLDELTVAEFGYQASLQCFRENVAPQVHWNVEELSNWPHKIPQSMADGIAQSISKQDGSRFWKWRIGRSDLVQ